MRKLMNLLPAALFGLVGGLLSNCAIGHAHTQPDKSSAPQDVLELLRVREIQLVTQDGTVLGSLGAGNKDGLYSASLFLGRQLEIDGYHDSDGVSIRYAYSPDESPSGFSRMEITNPTHGGLWKTLIIDNDMINFDSRGVDKNIDLPRGRARFSRDAMFIYNEHSVGIALSAGPKDTWATLELTRPADLPEHEAGIFLKTPLSPSEPPSIVVKDPKNNVMASLPAK